MELQKALSIIRNKYPNRLVWNAFKYNNAYIFSVAQDNKFIRGDTTVQDIAVDLDTGDISEINGVLENYHHPIEWNKAIKETLIDIDVSRKDWQ